jgi:hypothetical protein
MSNYVQSTNFATKDALSSGDPLKIVRGTEINTEFTNIAVAVATKADLASPTFTGTVTLPSGAVGVTQSFGDSDTSLATTAFVQAALQALHPVGSIYTSTSSTNPGTSFGFGTWIQFGAGRVLIGDGGGYSAGGTGGSADAVVVSHTHTATVSDPGHAHTYFSAQIAGALINAASPSGGGLQNTSTASTGISVTNSATGVSGTNANLQPYVVVYMWNRTA